MPAKVAMVVSAFVAKNSFPEGDPMVAMEATVGASSWWPKQVSIVLLR